MPRKASETTKPAPVNAYRIACVLESALGYMTLQPVDGRSLEKALLDGMQAMGLARGDRVVVVLSREMDGDG